MCLSDNHTLCGQRGSMCLAIMLHAGLVGRVIGVSLAGDHASYGTSRQREGVSLLAGMCV